MVGTRYGTSLGDLILLSRYYLWYQGDRASYDCFLRNRTLQSCCAGPPMKPSRSTCESRRASAAASSSRPRKRAFHLTPKWFADSRSPIDRRICLPPSGGKTGGKTSPNPRAKPQWPSERPSSRSSSSESSTLSRRRSNRSKRRNERPHRSSRQILVAHQVRHRRLRRLKGRPATSPCAANGRMQSANLPS